MIFRRAMAIAKKDLNEVFSSISIYGPMLGVPVFFAIMLPIMTFYITQYAAPNIIGRFTAMPANTALSGLSNVNGFLFMVFFTVNVLGPVFLTMPIFTASVIAADSFAGEKERKTSESLLATPVKTGELLFGKILASFIPTIALTVAIFIIYGGITNILSYQIFSTYILPDAAWLMMLLASPFLALATIGVVVLVSSHVKGIKEAQQISTLLVLPILTMPFASVIGVATLTVQLLAYIILFLIIADVVILYLGIKSFRKEGIL